MGFEPGIASFTEVSAGNIHNLGPYYGRADTNNAYGLYMRLHVNNGYTVVVYDGAQGTLVVKAPDAWCWTLATLI